MFLNYRPKDPHPIGPTTKTEEPKHFQHRNKCIHVKKLAMKHVNNFLLKTLKLKDPPCTRKDQVVEVWEKLFPKVKEAQFHSESAYILAFLKQNKFVKSTVKELTLKDVNGFLMKTLKMKKKPATTNADMIPAWERLFPEVVRTLQKRSE